MKKNGKKPVSRSEDIYGTGRSDPATEHFSPSQSIFLPHRWREYREQAKWTPGLVLSILLAVFSVGAGFIVARLYLVTDADIEPEKVPVIKRPYQTGMRMIQDVPDNPELSTRQAMLVDALDTLQPVEIDMDSAQTLDTRSLKLAAYHIHQAEKAYEQNALDKALTHYTQALQIFPELKDARDNIGVIYLQQKKFNDATAYFEQAIEEGTESAGLYNNLGVAYLQTDRPESAESVLQKALSMSPDYSPVYLNLAILSRRQGDYREAMIFYEQYLERNPSDFRVAQNYAMLLIEMEEWEKAARMLDSIRRYAPDLAPAYFRFAQALAHTDHTNEAVQALTQGAALMDPRKALGWMARPDFDALRDNPDFRVLINELSAAEK